MSEVPENLPERVTPSHHVPDWETVTEIVIDGFSGYSSPSVANSFQQELDQTPEGAVQRIPVEQRSEVQKTFDGTRELLSKASSQIPEENGLVYTGDGGVVEHPFNMDALVALNNMSLVRRACINALATNAVRLGYRIKKTIALAGESDADEVSEQIIDFLEKCADQDDSSFSDLAYKIKYDEESCGNGYMEVTRDREGHVAGFHYVQGRTIWIRRDRSGFVQRIAGKEQGFYNFGDKWKVNPDGSRDLLANRDEDVSELIHFKLHNSDSNYYGVPRDVAAITTMYGDELARNHNTKFFTHSATPDLLLVFEVDKAMSQTGAPGGRVPKVKISEATKKDIADHFRRNLTASSFTPGIFHLPPGVKMRVERLSSEQKDAGWINYRRENRAEVQIAFQTPGVMIANSGDGSNYATVMQEKSLYLESMVQPEQVRYQDRLMSKLWPELTRITAPATPDLIDETGDLTKPASVVIKPKEGTGVNPHIWKLDFVRMSIADAATMAQIHNIYGTLGVITIDEIRSDIGKKSMPGGDKSPQPKPGAEGNAGAQNADMKQVAAGNPDLDSFVSNMRSSSPLAITGLPSTRGPVGTVSLPQPRRVGDQSSQAANLFTAGQPVRKSTDEAPDVVVMTQDAYDMLHSRLAKAEEGVSAPGPDSEADPS